MNQMNLDYNKHCVVPFGTYVQANHKTNPTNTNKPRTLDAIYLHPTDNIQGGHELMDLNSGRVITRRKVTEIPVTELVIKAIEQMAYNEGFKSLKFKNRCGVIFHDTDWIAGVDYDRNDLEIGTGESDEESEPYQPEYLAGEPEDDEMDAEEIDPDEIDDILHDAESNPNEYQGQDQEESEMNELTTWPESQKKTRVLTQSNKNSMRSKKNPLRDKNMKKQHKKKTKTHNSLM